MSNFKILKINNTKEQAVSSGKWKDPGAKLYDQLLNAFYCDGDIPTDPKELEKKIKESKYLQWNDFLKEAYLVAPIKGIKNSPCGVTPYSRSGCKYPHHVIRNGELVVSIPGLKAAYTRVKQMGIFSGEVKEHLERHYKELGIYEDSTMVIEEKIDQNFKDIEDVIYEHTGIDLHCPPLSILESTSSLEDIQDPREEIENSFRWIESFVHDEIFRESALSELLTEASHGKLKYDFRIGWDYNTGHKIKVVYSLDNINITNVGDFYLQHSGYNKGETKDSYLDYTRKNITKKGNLDHQSKGQKVLAIIDLVTNKRLSNVKLINPFCPGVWTREMKQSDVNKMRMEADRNPTNYINEIEVGKVDNKSVFKTTHYPTKSTIDPKTGEDLHFRRIAKEEAYKQGRGKKIDNMMTKDFRVYGTDDRYNTFVNPNKHQAIQELYMRERDIMNYVKELDKHKDEVPDYQTHRANEINNLRIIQRDIRTIKNGKYDLSIMKKYRESDEGRLAGLTWKQLLEYHTYMDFRPSEESIYDIDISCKDDTASYTISESSEENKESDKKNNFVPIFGIVKSYSSDSVRNDGTIKSAGELASVKFDKIIHMLTRGDNYSHALVSFDDSLTNMYSYEDEGFVVDNIMEKESWMGTKSIYICVMFVNKEDRDRMKKYVKDLKKNQHLSRYASSNLLQAYVGTPKKVDKRFVCSSFTGYIMSCSNPKNLHRDFSRLRPEDITILPRAFYVMNVKDREDFKAKRSEIKSKVRSIYNEYHDEIDDYNNHLPKILLKNRCDELKTIDKIFDWIIDRME